VLAVSPHVISTVMRLSVNTPENFYPDLIEKGGLVSALQSTFSEIQSPVKVLTFTHKFFDLANC
jgi:hypothetical protein